MVTKLLVATDSRSSLDHRHAHVAALAPACAPAVANDPVPVLGGDAVAHSHNCMVQSITVAARIVENARRVALKDGCQTVKIGDERAVGFQVDNDCVNVYTTSRTP